MSASGYPDKLCNYCQLQLNMFHAFVIKARKAHDTYTELLLEIQQNSDETDFHIKSENDDEEINEEVVFTDDEVIEYNIKDETIEENTYELSLSDDQQQDESMEIENNSGTAINSKAN